ncbi:hypothetical protein NT6N_12860 [Oceaniferula spumae]|uniref:YdhG-like domain-containing protein n=1 Tax=Oceaniferula spumae TaxID=2979115 RepID=A0AAT9FJI7_9BACT
MNSKVDDYISEASEWSDELGRLRAIILDCGLTEEFKWRAPCYTFQKKNVLMLGALKESCVLSFLKGALLKDARHLLSKPGENTQAARVIRFTQLQEILEVESTLKNYIHEAIEIEKSGVQVPENKNAEPIPEELQNAFDQSPSFKTAFEALTPGRQRGYILYFSAAKQSATRVTRIEKYTPRIMDGKGIHDCTCGLSKKMPTCDGSHKFIK